MVSKVRLDRVARQGVKCKFIIVFSSRVLL